MIGTFAYLTARTLVNRIAARLRRLRQPRYLVGLIVGLAYLYWFVLRHQIRETRRGDLTADPQFAAVLPAVLVAGGLVLWAVSLAAWAWPSSGRPPLRFSKAEVQFFFTAPVTRRQLVHFKLLRSQIGIVFGLVVVSIFSGAAASGRVWFLLGGWLLFATLRLHLVGVGFTRASLARSGRLGAHAWVPLSVIGALSAVILGTWALNLPALASLPFGAAARRAFDAFSSGPGGIALRPFSALVAPALAVNARQFLAWSWPAALLLALNYWWALHAETTLEEASDAAERAQASGRRKAPRPVARKPPFRLGQAGRPEIAVLWKNLIFGGRYLTPVLALRLILPLLLVAAFAASRQAAPGLAPVALIVAGAAAVLGPHIVRYDLRHDLSRLVVLKTWPVRGAVLLRGELLAPALVLTLAVWAALAFAFVLSNGLDLGLSVADRGWLALAAALAAPSFLLAQLVIQNAAVIVFPGWIPTGGNRPRGVEAMGQQVLLFAGTLLLMALGVLPAAVVAAAAGFLLYQAVGYAGLVAAALVFSTALVAESLLAIELLGRLLERTDPAEVEAAEEDA